VRNSNGRKAGVIALNMNVASCRNRLLHGRSAGHRRQDESKSNGLRHVLTDAWLKPGEDGKLRVIKRLIGMEILEIIWKLVYDSPVFGSAERRNLEKNFTFPVAFLSFYSQLAPELFCQSS
jgi:hypothetical protein